MDQTWIPVAERLPDDGVVVDTIISDADGTRNHQPLKRDGRMWWLQGGEMYIYYTPTHWRPFA